MVGEGARYHGHAPLARGQGSRSSPGPVQSRARIALSFQILSICAAQRQEKVHQRSKSPHERRKPCTNCVNVTDAFSRKVPTYCAATPLRRCAKSALAPVKVATRDFSEAS